MAFAALISLKRTIERLKNPINPQITKSAYEELKSLEEVLKRLDSSRYSCNRAMINAVDEQIREAVYKLEDVLQCYVLYQSLSPSDSPGEKGWPWILPVDEKGVEREIVSFLKTVKNLREDYTRGLDNPLAREEDDVVDSLIDDFGGKSSITVGLSDQFDKIRNELLDLQSGLKFVSLFGMAGIGKTHLARAIYQEPIISQFIDLIAWVSVGPKRRIKYVLVDIVAQIERKPTNLYMKESEHRLGEHLYRTLHGRRYFIVLDDIWSTQALDDLMLFFPDRKNRSRILLTTRLEEVAKHPTTSSVHQMPFLTNEESWNLLWHNVFEESFPPELEEAGRKIAENCEGLPLLILVVANILCELEKTKEYWKKVADNKTTTFPDAYDKISKVLSSSYEYLPQHLKPCFLYLGVFPQKSEIPIPKLINLWTVEDFLEPNQSQTLEDLAMECLNKLISHSLVIVCKQTYIIKSVKLHSAYWHICVLEARKNKFLHVLNKFRDGSKGYIDGQRRLAIQNNILFGIKEVYDSLATALTARSLLCTGEDHKYPVPICLNLMLLKVLDVLAIRFYKFPNEVLKLLELRYLALTHNGNLPHIIFKLQNLQCLTVRQYYNIKLLRDSTRLPMQRSIHMLRQSTCLPKEIWYMPELKHLRIMGSNLPDPCYGACLTNLITLYVNAHSCTKHVLESVPYLKKLGIKIELQPEGAETLSCFKHIDQLHKLESLKCVVVNPRLRSQVVAPPDHLSNLPRGLRKLSLNGLCYSWEYMNLIGLLPNLQVLKLRCSAFQGPEWETKVEEFQSLEFLLLEDIDLVQWIIDDDDCFPHLRQLIIRHCYKLKEIPLGIGGIPTLEKMEVVDCSPLVVDFALHIQEDVRESANFSLPVLINSSWKL